MAQRRRKLNKSKPRWSMMRYLWPLALFVLVLAACSPADDGADTTAGGGTETTEASGGADTTEAAAPDTTEGAMTTEVIKLAVLSDCEGGFGGFYAQTLAGVGAAFAEFAGATITDPADPVAGFTGASVNGIPIELVGIGCGDEIGRAHV